MGERKIKEKEGTDRRSSQAGAKTDNATTLSVAEEANAFSVGDNRACSNRRSGKNEYGDSEGIETRDGGSKKGLLYDKGK